MSEVCEGPGYLVTLSADQTTRVFSRCADGWHELARPQVHGYDINSGALLPRAGLTPWLVSGGDEKVLRVFGAPFHFLKLLNSLHFNDPEALRYAPDKTNAQLDALGLGRGGGVAKPALGLLNKQLEAQPLEAGVDPAMQFDPDSYLSSAGAAGLQEVRVPVEDELAQLTLWPEVKKLYGHVHEIFAVAASHDGKALASACKAQTPKRAEIVLWSVQV